MHGNNNNFGYIFFRINAIALIQIADRLKTGTNAIALKSISHNLDTVGFSILLQIVQSFKPVNKSLCFGMLWIENLFLNSNM